MISMMQLMIFIRSSGITLFCEINQSLENRFYIHSYFLQVLCQHFLKNSVILKKSLLIALPYKGYKP